MTGMSERRSYITRCKITNKRSTVGMINSIFIGSNDRSTPVMTRSAGYDDETKTPELKTISRIIIRRE